MAERLADAVSPYLRAHADNPVDWYPWGPEAFRVASERDVPVLISIGYATCHWCHVMARESFSDPAIAAILSTGFVAIKVDREEHPDVDSSYLAAASAFTRQLGWPLTVFTDPRGRAFYAGTYFPPRAAPGMPSFAEVLGAVTEAWRQRRGELEQTADAVAEAISAASVMPDGEPLPDAEALREIAGRLAAEEDPVHGGFGGAPKFPVAPVLAFLAETGPASRAVALRTMRRMGASALRDPVEGGFFRYATRADWTEPHYERMLSDNALLLGVAAELSRDADDGFLRDLQRGLIHFLLDVMRLPSGGFASAQDSESIIDGERSEGGYYRRDAAARADLAPPALDEKVLTGWNGLAIGALARSGTALGGDDGRRAIDSARDAARMLLAEHVEGPGALARASRDGVRSAARPALEDTGMFAEGLLELAIATGEVEWAVQARRLVDRALAAAAAAGSGAVFEAPDGADPVLAAHGLAMPADPAEGAAPSGLTTTARAARLLHALGAGTRYLDAAREAMAGVAEIARQRPIAFGGALRLMAELAAPLVQVVTVLPDMAAVDDAAAELVDATRRAEASVAVVVTDGQARAFADAGFELFEARTSRGGRAMAYRCEAFVCALPVADARALEKGAG
ncbi:DUF255 domain-containing protein [Agromyces sp. CFH 90414]|uniref:DUF255 domain-containing protein n=1 Tax=Agromyces agglutinans TaxID=2662258 RepID=A0A6I2FEA0_9MICO|nr:DUF255 domain-containing protein [Agromyces agglutinans]MRG60846.1 DUF255 domain-containing protein [Agromyces agglutinans]